MGLKLKELEGNKGLSEEELLKLEELKGSSTEIIKSNKLKVISIEGIDRSGKTTIKDKLTKIYDKDSKVNFKKFPDKSSAYGRMVYECLATDLDKYKANYCLYNSMDKNQGIEQLTNKSGVLLVDRFDVTQYVYGKGLGVSNPLDYLRYESDVVIYIDISVEESLRRGDILQDNDLLEGDSTILESVSQHYTEYLELLSTKGREVHYIDGLQSREDILEAVVSIIESHK